MVLRGATSLFGAPLKTIKYGAIKTTGTLIVIVSPFTSVSSSNSQQGPPLSSLSDKDIPGNSRRGAGAGNQGKMEVVGH